ncbi:MAG: UDP binding domain-containing protein [Lachnospiraceae bacterium]
MNSLKEDYLDKTVIVGIYRLTMKHESDNFRDSSIYDMITELQMQDIKIVVYEPLFNSTNAYYDVINELTDFIEITDIIVANRLDEELKNVSDKVIFRDIFLEIDVNLRVSYERELDGENRYCERMGRHY